MEAEAGVRSLRAGIAYCISYPTLILRTELRFFGRTTNILNC